MPRILPLRLVACLLSAALAGCSHSGPQRAAVSGSIAVDHQPLAEGSITFIPVEGTGGPSAGGIVRDGRYDLPATSGPVVGRQRVEIRGFRQTGKTVRDIWKPGESVAERMLALDAEYNDNSTLRCDIQTGRNQLDYDLPGRKDP